VGATRLYLDTARLGRMTPRAQQAHLDFARLAGEEGGSLYFERFLQGGMEAWPEGARGAYPGLCSWRGVAALKSSLRQLASSPPELPVLLAARSLQLMKLAACLLMQTCRNVLVSDVGWPPYHDVLAAEARLAGRRVRVAPVGAALFEGKASADEVVAALQACAVENGCDGLFLTAVSHLGVRLPVERIVRALEAAHELRFVVIDGAQDFCHVGADLRNDYCDLYLAGCHKWLGACHPMGLGFYGRRRSRGVIETVLEQLLQAGEVNDPLLLLSTQLEGDRLDGRTETVNLAPLFAGQGAVDDALQGGVLPGKQLAIRLANLDAVADVAPGCGWQPRLFARDFQTAILLLQAQSKEQQQLSPEALRHRFSQHGVAVTAYDQGVVRLSMPQMPWQSDELAYLQDTFRALA
jgi:hypothetical protein